MREHIHESQKQSSFFFYKIIPGHIGFYFDILDELTQKPPCVDAKQYDTVRISSSSRIFILNETCLAWRKVQSLSVHSFGKGVAVGSVDASEIWPS